MSKRYTLSAGNMVLHYSERRKEFRIEHLTPQVFSNELSLTHDDLLDLRNLLNRLTLKLLAKEIHSLTEEFMIVNEVVESARAKHIIDDK